MPDIFISYCSQDRPVALKLVQELQAAGYHVWIDKHGIEGSTSWSGEIAKALSNAESVVFLLSAGALASKNVAKELSLAAELDKHIVPVELERVKLSGDFLYHLSGVQRVAIEDGAALMRALRTRTGGMTITEQPQKPSSVKKQAEQLRLAVLPFDDLSPSQDNEWFADGMMDELISTLGGLSELKVPGRSDVIYYKKLRPKAAEIARDLHVRYLIEGSVRKAGEKIRITVQLTDTDIQERIWSEKYDGTFDDIFDLQESVAKKVTEALRLRLTPEEEKKIEQKGTHNVLAYKLYLQANTFHDKHTLADYERAMDLYKKALELDPSFVSAHVDFVSIALTYHRFYSRDNKWIALAEEHIRSMEKIAGESARLYFLKSSLALRQGRFEDALQFAQRSAQIEPSYSAAYQAIGYAYQGLGKKEEAVTAWAETVRLVSNDLANQFNYLLSINELGDRERLKEAAGKALSPYEHHLRYTPDDNNARANYANILSWAGEKDRALAEAAALVDDGDALMLYNLACLYLTNGDTQRGAELLHRSLDKGLRNIEGFASDPDLDALRGTPEFDVLVKELEEKIAREGSGS